MTRIRRPLRLDTAGFLIAIVRLVPAGRASRRRRGPGWQSGPNRGPAPPAHAPASPVRDQSRAHWQWLPPFVFSSAKSPRRMSLRSCRPASSDASFSRRRARVLPLPRSAFPPRYASGPRGAHLVPSLWVREPLIVLERAHCRGRSSPGARRAAPRARQVLARPRPRSPVEAPRRPAISRAEVCGAAGACLNRSL